MVNQPLARPTRWGFETFILLGMDYHIIAGKDNVHLALILFTMFLSYCKCCRALLRYMMDSSGELVTRKPSCAFTSISFFPTPVPCTPEKPSPPLPCCLDSRWSITPPPPHLISPSQSVRRALTGRAGHSGRQATGTMLACSNRRPPPPFLPFTSNLWIPFRRSLRPFFISVVCLRLQNRLYWSSFHIQDCWRYEKSFNSPSNVVL
jgi:hypothetical protein